MVKFQIMHRETQIGLFPRISWYPSEMQLGKYVKKKLAFLAEKSTEGGGDSYLRPKPA